MIETIPLEQAADAYRPHDARQSTVPRGPHHECLRQLEYYLDIKLLDVKIICS
jgi:hypothetical protein